jgi:hypothetical protein
MTKAAFFAAVLFLVAGAAGAETYPQLPPRAPLPNAVTCANRVLASEASWGEQRPDNADENRRTGSYTFNGVINGVQGSQARYGARVHGHSRTSANAPLTTTREVIYWGACYWGLSGDLTAARAIMESSWRMTTVGDRGNSYGLLQIKRTVHRHTYPMTKYRTPFGIDYANGWQRACVDGNFTWLGSDYISSNAERRTWGCIRAWYSGLWYDEGSDFYEAQVRYILAQRFWEQPGFFH